MSLLLSKHILNEVGYLCEHLTIIKLIKSTPFRPRCLPLFSTGVCRIVIKLFVNSAVFPSLIAGDGAHPVFVITACPVTV